ncbi:MAG: hypothetical protein A3J93_03545 [Candidatus Magasanikbacteria bacterium RIFOXYC2_FULL_42_28]|uniref:PRC-barrel domain-containing protein n=1 Tax=Candidatus Magasanikbacteria bacterium RIFOXYC2_FULL_42_28 TaxID=1798704 RepID=A0A1F6NUG2_9BACT|nr:MAG: hypothetical protein A3J93_03545 [Candidatus Magasanikbacteria bacterium RIFOXYC2_FULL_42_28]
MKITFSQLKKLSVQTQSGVYLGKVVDVVLSVEENLILQYKVRSYKIVGHTFLINNSQVREITAEKIVVDDASLPDATAVFSTSV